MKTTRTPSPDTMAAALVPLVDVMQLRVYTIRAAAAAAVSRARDIGLDVPPALRASSSFAFPGRGDNIKRWRKKIKKFNGRRAAKIGRKEIAREGKKSNCAQRT